MTQSPAPEAYFLDGTLDDPRRIAEVERRLAALEAELPSGFLSAPTGLAGAALLGEEEGGAAATMAPEERYELGALLGEGGMGRVYRAVDRQLRRTIALKLIAPAADRGAATVREARAQARVRHPGVIAVYETGELHGQAYVAMQHVDGPTLGEAAAGLPRETLVRLLADVAEALHAAHLQGLVHRDVKPSNVLVEETPDGKLSAFVGDFGIAQAIEDGPLPAAGTLAYMAPEQLRGEAVDRRADVYGLGVTLYRLLAGRLPYDAESEQPAALIESILVTQALPLREAAPSLPVELAAIVERAMAREPGARYPSALALAADLRRYLAGEVVEAYAASLAYRLTRHLLRHRTLWTVVAGALVVVLSALVVFSVLTRRAERVADLRRNQAEELLAFMVGDLRAKLAPVNKLEVLEDVGNRALAYFASVPASELRPNELSRRSQALHQIGDVRMRQGDLPAAMEAFTSALELAEDLHRRDPERLDWLFELGQSQFWVGYVFFERGQLDAARAHFGSYLEIGRRLAAAEPGNPDYLLEVGYGHDNVGRVLEARGDAAGALDHFARHGEILRQVIVLRPEQPALRGELAGNRILVGRIHLDAGRGNQALDALREGREILEALAAEQPTRLEWRERLATCDDYLGEALETLGDLDAAQRQRDRQLAAARALMAEDPGNARWRFFAAVAAKGAARVSRLRGDWSRHGREAESARVLLDALLAGDATKTTWRREHALVGLELAAGALRAGAFENALREAEAARATLDVLAVEQPGRRSELRNAARAHLLLSEIEAVRGDVVAAGRHRLRADELQTKGESSHE